MKDNFYVYEHWRLDKDECFYVGKGRGKRAYSRQGRNSHWNNIVSKLERLGSGYEVKLVAVGLNENDAFYLEKERIMFWRDIVDLSNMTDGGEGISNPSKEVREKLSRAKIGKISPRKGKINSEEHRKNISKAKKGKPPPNKGKKSSDELRAKLSAAHKGKPNNQLGRRHSEESRIKMAKSAKKRWALTKTGDTQ